jgi:hypothetical protein
MDAFSAPVVGRYMKMSAGVEQCGRHSVGNSPMFLRSPRDRKPNWVAWCCDLKLRALPYRAKPLATEQLAISRYDSGISAFQQSASARRWHPTKMACQSVECNSSRRSNPCMPQKELNEEGRKAGKEGRRASPLLLSCFPYRSFRIFAFLFFARLVPVFDPESLRSEDEDEHEGGSPLSWISTSTYPARLGGRFARPPAAWVLCATFIHTPANRRSQRPLPEPKIGARSTGKLSPAQCQLMRMGIRT